MIQVRNLSQNALNGRSKAKCAHKPIICGMSKCLFVAHNGMVMQKKKNQRAIQEGENKVEHDF